MKVYYKSADRKALAQAVSTFTGENVRYMAAPTFIYKVGNCTIDREGNLEIDDAAVGKKIDALLAFLAQKGYSAAQQPPQAAESIEQDELLQQEEESTQWQNVVAMPLEMVQMENLEKILVAKGGLICKALGISEAKADVRGDKVLFPWLTGTFTDMKRDACLRLVGALCKMSCAQKRFSTKAKAVENEKYAFRCFLLRLGFIGREYKAERKELLAGLEGNSAFKHKREVARNVC